MKIIHTSDWHLGQMLYSVPREAEHAAFLSWLAELIRVEAPDALLIAGDIFDTANPPPSAQKLFYSFLGSLARSAPHLQIVTIAGNHDSAGRIASVSELLKLLRIHQIGMLARDTAGDFTFTDACVPLRDAQGDIQAWVLAIPFLRPFDHPPADHDGTPLTLSEGARRVYEAARAHACRQRAPHQALIAMGHCFMAGGVLSEHSERKIQRGNQEAIPVDLFAREYDYVALGHLHKAQCVGGLEHVRYCGSPLPLSFAERTYAHCVLCATFEEGRLGEVREIPVPRPRLLLSVPDAPARLDDLLAQLLQVCRNAPSDQESDPRALLPFLEVRALLDAPEPALRARIEKALEGARCHLLRIEVSVPKGPSESSRLASAQELNALEPEDLFKQRYRQEFSAEPSAELLGTFRELVDLVAAQEHA